MLALPAFSHISLEAKTAQAGSVYKAVFQVGHGCQGAATTGVSVQIPAGFQGAKPYPKAGWTLTTQSAKLAQPYASHGKPVTEDVSVVSWTAASQEAALQEAHFDEFMLRGTLPETGGGAVVQGAANLRKRSQRLERGSGRRRVPERIEVSGGIAASHSA